MPRASDCRVGKRLAVGPLLLRVPCTKSLAQMALQWGQTKKPRLVPSTRRGERPLMATTTRGCRNRSPPTGEATFSWRRSRSWASRAHSKLEGRDGPREKLCGARAGPDASDRANRSASEARLRESQRTSQSPFGCLVACATRATKASGMSGSAGFISTTSSVWGSIWASWGKLVPPAEIFHTRAQIPSGLRCGEWTSSPSHR